MFRNLRLSFTCLLIFSCLNAHAEQCPDWPAERALIEVTALQKQIDTLGRSLSPPGSLAGRR